MNRIRLKKALRNILIVIILIPILVYSMGLYFSPESAHIASERSIHYGPSKIVKEVEFEKGIYYLCKYDKWVSCDTVLRKLGFLWRFGSQVIGFENELDKKVVYSYMISNIGDSYYMKFYGVVNDDSITRIEIITEDETTIIDEFYQNLFLYTTKESSSYFKIKKLKAYTINDELVFEKEF